MKFAATLYLAVVTGIGITSTYSFGQSTPRNTSDLVIETGSDMDEAENFVEEYGNISMSVPYLRS